MCLLEFVCFYRVSAVNSQYCPTPPNTSQYFSITSHSKQVFTLRRYSVCRFFTAFAGSRIDGGFFGKFWEGLGRFGRVWVYCRQLEQQHVWRLMPQNHSCIVCGRLSDWSDWSDGCCRLTGDSVWQYLAKKKSGLCDFLLPCSPVDLQ